MCRTLFYVLPIYELMYSSHQSTDNCYYPFLQRQNRRHKGGNRKFPRGLTVNGRVGVQIQVPEVDGRRSTCDQVHQHRVSARLSRTNHSACYHIKSPLKWYLAPSWHRKTWSASVSLLDKRACRQKLLYTGHLSRL